MRAGDAALLFLSAASGATDVIAFVLLGHVFTSAMTGNTALLGLALGTRDAAAAGRSAFALAGFLCGIVAATWLHPHRAARSLRPLFLVEMVLVAGFAFAWPAFAADGAAATHALIFLSALAMGMQGLTAREASRFGMTTIVFTSALLRIAETAARRILRRAEVVKERRHAAREFSAYLAYAGAAAFAALFLRAHLRWLVWLPALAVAAAALCYEIAELAAEKGREQYREPGRLSP